MYLCKRMKLCSFLLTNGFNYKKVVQDRNNPKYNCWLFDDTPELRSTVDTYYSERKQPEKNCMHSISNDN